MRKPWKVAYVTLFWLTSHGSTMGSDGTPPDAGPAKAARLALVSDGKTEAVRNILDLAQANLSSVKGVVLLDRAVIERIMAEQKLSLAGLVDAGTAVQAGKLLNVDLFAVAEAGPGGKDVLSLVVYDGVTGVKLWDNAVPDGGLERHANDIASGVRAAAAKWRIGPAKLATLSFMPVRNADLPSDKDAFCQALAGILERRLVNSGNLAVLERKRLEFVNQEKALLRTRAYEGLLASLVLVEMQVSRSAQADGVRVVVFLSDHRGKPMAKITAQATESKIADLIDSLADQINEKLAAPAAVGPRDTVPEGKRFAREALLLLSHEHYEQALQAAEAAYALAPAQPEHAASLVRCLTTEALFLVNPASMHAIFGGAVKLKVEPMRLKASLRLARRGFNVRAGVVGNLPRTPSALGFDFAINILTIDSQRFYRNHLQFYDPAAFDAEAIALKQDLLAAMNRLVIAEVTAQAEVARLDPKAFSTYTLHLLQRFETIQTQAVSSESFTSTIDQLVRAWLQIGAKQDFATISPSYLVWFLRRLGRHHRLSERKFMDDQRGRSGHVFRVVPNDGKPSAPFDCRRRQAWPTANPDKKKANSGTAGPGGAYANLSKGGKLAPRPAGLVQLRIPRGELQIPSKHPGSDRPELA